MGLIKIFSGAETLALTLKAKIEEKGVNVVLKDNIQSSRLSGSGNVAVELFIQEFDFGKANPIIEDFRMNL